MTEARGSELEYRKETIEGYVVGVVSYRIGSRFSCRVDNVDPGAIIGRGGGPTREEAEKLAIEKATLSLDLMRATQALQRSVDHLQGNGERPAPSSRRLR